MITNRRSTVLSRLCWSLAQRCCAAVNPWKKPIDSHPLRDSGPQGCHNCGQALLSKCDFCGCWSQRPTQPWFHPHVAWLSSVHAYTICCIPRVNVLSRFILGGITQLRTNPALRTNRASPDIRSSINKNQWVTPKDHHIWLPGSLPQLQWSANVQLGHAWTGGNIVESCTGPIDTWFYCLIHAKSHGMVSNLIPNQLAEPVMHII